jgi:protein arginine N-methyltransferase 1
LRIEYHRTLIADHVRLAAFRDALKAQIEPGVTTVADIGAGAGVIGVMAARLGARRVYMYECAEISGVAERVLRRNKARACVLFPCRSTEFVDPPRVDLVVSETLGNYALEEDIIDTMRDAKARHLRPGGRLVPREIRQFVAPVVSPRIDRELRAWRDVPAAVGLDVDLSPAEALSVNNMYVRSISARELLEPAGFEWDHIALGDTKKSVRRGEGVWRLKAAATAYGFALWWTADLGAGVILSTAPGAPQTHWEQLYLPLVAPLSLAADERLRILIRSTTSPVAGTRVSWTALREAADGALLAKQAMDLEKGFLP